MSAIKEVRIFDSTEAASPMVPVFAPDPDGSFPEKSVGDTILNRVYLEAVDKAGNVSTRVLSGKVQATYNLAGKVAHTRSPSPLAMFGFAAADPLSSWPGLGPSLVDELGDSENAAALAADGSRVFTGGSTDTRTSPASWTERTPAGFGRKGGAMAYDSAHGKAVLFGGFGGDDYSEHYLSDTWEWDGTLGTWTERVPVGPKPSARVGHAMVYDSARAKVVLIGGQHREDFSVHYLSDTWEWDGELGTWTERVSGGASPSGRQGHAMVFDAARGKVFLFGGSDPNRSFEPLQDAWDWDGTRATWTERTPVGTIPSGREGHAMGYDAARGKVVLFGGHTCCGSLSHLGDTWEWDGEVGTWTERVPATASPSARSGHAMAYDSARRSVVLFGGIQYYVDAWEWDGASGTWTYQSPTRSPYGRSEHAGVYDPSRGRIVMFGGYFDGRGLRDTWEFTGAGVPHSRHAVHTAVLQLDDGSTASSISAKWVGAGAGEDPANPGVSTPGAQFYVWDWAAGAWELLGSHDIPVASCDEPGGSACTVEGVPSGDPGNYLRSGRIWLMAVPAFASSAPPGTAVNSEIHTDYIEARVSYTLP
ncbi:MAG: hypothetical protein HY897_12940 [Deltaproteobacteria bacterium]|nr:hypothetical protein [Deltaproteobacteria bacterium]